MVPSQHPLRATILAALLVPALVAAAPPAPKRIPKPESPATKPGAATGGRSVALVIGNKAYPKRPLMNPVNDATDLVASLKELGFETQLVLDAGRERFEKEVDAFTARLNPGDVALFYFSGHGIRVSDQNYLLPIDFTAETEARVKYQAVSASQVKDLMQERGVRLSILMLDACRDNPYRSWRSGSGGLGAMSGRGSYIAFAADEGKTADDNPAERNGLFTKHLLTALRSPGLTIDQVFTRVREGVDRESGGRQTPFSYSGVVGDFWFRPGAAAAPAAPAPSVDVKALDLAYWQAIQGGDAEAYRSYLEKYPSGEFAIPARLKLKQLASPAATPTAVVVAQNIGFAVPIDDAKNLVPQLKEGQVVRGFLGIKIGPIEANVQESLGLKSREGVLVQSVENGLPAEKAGIRHEDVIIRVDQVPVKQNRDLIDYVSGKRSGTRVTLTFIRGGQEKTTVATLETRREEGEAAEAEPAADENREKIGISFDDLSQAIRNSYSIGKDIEGVVLTHVKPVSAAGDAGLREGDVIQEVNGTAVSNVAGFRAELKKAGDARFARFYVHRPGPRPATFIAAVRLKD